MLGVAGSLLAFLSLPPANLWPLAWLAAVPWGLAIRDERLTGRRPYLALWVAGLAFWLPSLYWLCLAHPATSIGWIALCSYLACYLPVFVGLSRVAVHQLRVPLPLAAPVVWTGLELAQAHLLTGFDMAALSHSQYRWLAIIQIADLVGAYGVTFLIVLVGASIAAALPRDGKKFNAWPRLPATLLPAALMIAAAVTYGMWRQSAGVRRPGPTITLVQGNIDTEMKFDPGEGQRVFDHYVDLTKKALKDRPTTDLIVWPETMFRFPLREIAEDAQIHGPAGGWTIEDLRDENEVVLAAIGNMVRDFGKPTLLGVDYVHYGAGPETRYNTAQYFAADGTPGDRYDKSHPVMFGEYVPMANRWPWLYRISPLGSGIEAGARSPAMLVKAKEADDARLSVNICYETVLPHIIAGHVRRLIAEGKKPDVLVNLTNDGWFWGSHELDLHLVCGVFRAVECRLPLLVAANTGFSAWIDASGRIVQQGPRHAPGWIVADVQLDDRYSPYLHYGDWFAGLCLACCVAIGLAGGLARRAASKLAG